MKNNSLLNLLGCSNIRGYNLHVEENGFKMDFSRKNYLQNAKNSNEEISIKKSKISNFLILVLLFLFTNFLFAQNSCLITGNATSAPYPIGVISTQTNGSQLQYRVTASVPSSYVWSIINNTSGATFLYGLSQVVSVSPGSSVGSFTLTCKVTELADPTSINTCTISVAVNSQ